MTHFYSLAMNKKPHWIPQHAFIAGLYPRMNFHHSAKIWTALNCSFPSRNDSQTTQRCLGWWVNQACLNSLCFYLFFLFHFLNFLSLLQNTRNVGVFWQEGLLELCLKPSSSAINIKGTMWKLLQDIPLCGQRCRLDTPLRSQGECLNTKRGSTLKPTQISCCKWLEF